MRAKNFMNALESVRRAVRNVENSVIPNVGISKKSEKMKTVSFRLLFGKRLPVRLTQPAP